MIKEFGKENAANFAGLPGVPADSYSSVG